MNRQTEQADPQKGSYDHIKSAQERSDQVIDRLRSDRPSYENTYALLKAFVIDRFLIDDGFWDDRLAKLADHSIELAMQKAAEEDGGDDAGESLRDLSMNCAGASSSETKRALLLITLRKRLDLDLPPSMAATHDTIPLLAEEITRQLEKRWRLEA